MFTDDQGSQRETPDELSIELVLDLILVEVKHMRKSTHTLQLVKQSK